MDTQAPPSRSDEQKLELVERILRGQLTLQEACAQYGLSGAQLKEWVRMYRREARRVLDDRVRAALSTQGMDLEDLESAEFSGSVEDLAIAELIQTMELGRKNAEILIEHDGQQSRIWCVDGAVIDAECGRLLGAPAVYRLLALDRGRVHADFSPVERVRTINVSTQALLMESARRTDECCRLRERLGDLQAIFVPSDHAMSPAAQASPTEYAVLRLLDGERSLEQVVRDSLLPDLETLTHLLALRERGLMELSAAPRVSHAPLMTPADRKPLGMDEPVSELTFAPFAASLGARVDKGISRRLVWGTVAVGATTLGAAVALRWSERHDAKLAAEVHRQAALRSAVSASATPVAPPTPLAVAPIGFPAEGSHGSALPVSPARRCPDGAVLLPGVGSAYCLDRLEVTVASYADCSAARPCELAGKEAQLPDAQLTPEQRRRAQSAFGAQCNATAPERDQHPVNCVSYADAERYCHWRGGRLPTEAEWDFAAKGSEGRPFPWGAGEPSAKRVNACGVECRSWYTLAGLQTLFSGIMYDADDGFPSTAPVGSFPEGNSPDGVSDLIGNVAEWTQGRIDDSEDDPESGNVITRVVRGGAFTSNDGALRPPVWRVYLNSEARDRSVGFRCAYDPR
jgi:formylglycine-generating enzyme required for sulfatase activity